MPHRPEVHRWYCTAGWQRRSAHQLMIEPLCRLCLEADLVTPATVADHIEPHRGEFRGSVVTSDAGPLAYREPADAIGLTVMASDVLTDARTGKNGQHAVAGLFRQSVFGRLAGYEDV